MLETQIFSHEDQAFFRAQLTLFQPTLFLLTVFLHFLNFRLRSLGKRAVHPNNQRKEKREGVSEHKRERVKKAKNQKQRPIENNI